MKRLFIYIYLYMMVMFLAVNFGIVPLFNKVINNHIEREVGLYWSNITRGFFHVMERDLQRMPVEKWENAVKSMGAHFSYPITVKPLASLALSEEERLELASGGIAVKGGGEFFRHQIGASGMVLTLGPIPDFEFNEFILQVWFSIIVAVLFSIFALIWALPYTRKLIRISTAAKAFGKGEFDVRAKLPPRSTLAPLASAFNGMADQIQELISSHKELTHAVSHELRTPLARMRFSMEMVASEENPDNREKQLEGMRRDVDELDLLVSELLTYAKLDKGFRPQMEAMDLGPWLADLAALLDDEHTKVAIECRISSPSATVPVQASPRFLERSLRNIVQNAARYTAARIHITLKTIADQIIIHVDDDGPGIAPADRQRIFSPFVRLEAHSERTDNGYGLGLAIVSRVAEWHGGSVTVSEAPIGGARFSLQLPIAASSQEGKK